MCIYTEIEKKRMVKEFQRHLQQGYLGEEEDSKEMKQEKMQQQQWKAMEDPDLTLGLSGYSVATAESSNSSSSESEANSHKKRKLPWGQLRSESMIQTSVDLQQKDPLPLDWEQCLDLQSGRMYYLNRKTLKKSYSWPKEQKIDLELNISPLSSPEEFNSRIHDDSKMFKKPCAGSMVAVACLKCHLLVMLSRSSPCCPNCKYLHSLTSHEFPMTKAAAVKTLETLRLLN